MSDKQNLASDLIKAWQDQFQDYLKDPRLIELMTENYARFQENVQRTATADQQGASSTVYDDVNAQLHELGKRFDRLESRLAALEKSRTANKKANT